MLPSNIQQWLKNQGTSEQSASARKIAKWVVSHNRYIVGGTTIGKLPQTLILDIKHHGSEIYINSNGDISFNDEKVSTKKEFTAAYNRYLETNN